MSDHAVQKQCRCFVIGPIGADHSNERKHADFVFDGIIVEALQGHISGIHITRADKDSYPGMITDRIINAIVESEIVIADLTYLNPNVFYEIGIRHSNEKPIIHIAEIGTALPFDNLGHKVVFYDKTSWQSISISRQLIREQIQAAMAPEFVVTNPVRQALTAKAFRARAGTEGELVNDLLERISFIEKRIASPTTGTAGSSSAEGASKLIQSLVTQIDAQNTRRKTVIDVCSELGRRLDWKYSEDHILYYAIEIAGDLDSFGRFEYYIENGKFDDVQIGLDNTIPF